MKNKPKAVRRTAGIIALAAVIVFGMAACGPVDEDEPEVVTIFAIPGVTAPVTGAVPVSETSTAQYTASISWYAENSYVSMSPADGDTFKGGTVYRAEINLHAKEGYTLEGVPADSFTVAGAETATYAGEYPYKVYATFPATEAIPAYIGKWHTDDYNGYGTEVTLTFNSDGTYGMGTTPMGTYEIDGDTITLFTGSAQDYTLDSDTLTLFTQEYARDGSGTGLVGTWLRDNYGQDWGYELKSDGTYRNGYYRNGDFDTALGSISWGKYTYTADKLTLAQASELTFSLSADGDTLTTTTSTGTDTVYTREE